jgi:5-deoxy-glucuronate isomerase
MAEERVGSSVGGAGRWLFARGHLAREGWETVVDETIDGWAHTGLRVVELTAGERRQLPSAGVERLVVPLAGSFAVTYGERGRAPETSLLKGRASVFSGPTDVLYVGVGCDVSITGEGRVAVAEAKTGEALSAVHVPRERVAVELRGTGRNSRQVHNFGTPANLRASAFMVVEVITPALNWSSFPPHKHDEDVPGREAALEEIYYFEAAVTKGAAPRGQTDAIGFFRAYPSARGPIDFAAPVRTGDVALLPYGFHGPSVAAPGYDLYFLNVMAGPAHRREWLVTEDPDHAWIRGTFSEEPVDARLPYDDAPERAS